MQKRTYTHFAFMENVNIRILRAKGTTRKIRTLLITILTQRATHALTRVAMMEIQPIIINRSFLSLLLIFALRPN